MALRNAWLALIKHTLNPLTLRAARGTRSRFAIIRHVGRSTGRHYEAVVILAPVPEGFVAELTYGPRVAWYRNIVAAGHCEVLRHGELFDVSSIEPIEAAAGLRAYGPPESWVLRLLRRHDFALLRVAGRGIH